MEKKIKIIFEVIIIIACVVYYTVVYIIPENKYKYGSSDAILNTSIYKNMYEFNIDDKINFALLLNNEKKVYHLMFFTENTSCLYNKNIEKNDLKPALLKIIQILISEGYLNSKSTIEIIRYNDLYHDEFRDNLSIVLKKYNLNTNILESTNTVENKARKLGLTADNNLKSILNSIDYYSKKCIRNSNYKNISDTEFKQYTDDIYNQLLNFATKNNIKDLDKNSDLLIINLLSYQSNEKYYPTSKSWYYIKNNKIYAYIEFIINNKKVGYCYNGSIELVSRGECTNEKNT